MFKITIEDGGDDLYEIEAFDQDPKVPGATPHTVLINGEQVGHVRHDPEDGPWALARMVLVTFPAGETLKEQAGAHTALYSYWSEHPGELRRALEDYALQEPIASAQLADESPSSRLNREAVRRLRDRLAQPDYPQAGDR